MNRNLAISTTYHTILTCVCLAFLTILGKWVRAPGADFNKMRNQDIAGITYNADLLRHGKVPLVDSLEFKAPGSFFVTWMLWAANGRSMETLHRFAVVWAILASIGVFFAGRLMFGYASGIFAALIYIFYSPITDIMTVNYNTWMITPYIWSTVFFLLGLKYGGWFWFLSCGIAVTWAALFKRPGATIFPLYLGVLAIAPWLTFPRAFLRPPRASSIFAYFAGLFTGFLPLGIYYTIKGSLGAFIRSFFFSQFGWRYVGGEQGLWEKIKISEDAFLGCWEYLFLPTILACLTLVSVPLDKSRGRTLLGLLLGGHFLFSFAGVFLGFRFFQGYFLQVIPALAWLAAHPEGPILKWFQPERWRFCRLKPVILSGACILFLLVFCFAPASKDLSTFKIIRHSVTGLNSTHHDAERIGKIIKSKTRPEEKIWVWGRWAWPVYYFSDRLSSIRYYKVLGVITNNLTNTWRRPTEMTKFMPVGPYKEVGKGLKKTKPSFIVTANNEDYTGFKAFETLLRDQYTLYPHGYFSTMKLYWRKDLLERDQKKDKRHTKKTSPAHSPSEKTKDTALK